MEKTIIGLGKKVLIADILGHTVSIVVNNYSKSDSVSLWMCLLCYMLQIYYDFSGYSDMTIGISNMFGLKFDDNFNYPYLSCSVSDFFRRWHISLGQFFKKYIYIPLGGNKKSGKVYRNLLIVYIVSGLWHGNGASYIVWGLLVGAMVCLERYVDKNFNIKIPVVCKWMKTMLFIYFSWILFMMPNLSSSVLYIKKMFIFISDKTVSLSYKYYFNKRVICVMVTGMIAAIAGYRNCNKKLNEIVEKKKTLMILKYTILVIVFACSVITIVNSNYQPFLYARF